MKHISKDKPIKGWHFTVGLKLRDGTELVVGKTYQHDGELIMCERGYHSSRKIMDALTYAHGSYVSRVVSWGDVIEEKNKLVAECRKVLWVVDAEAILHEFACRCAEDGLAEIDNPGPRSIAAIKAKREWLKGEISDEELSTAWSAPGSTAWSAAGSAAWSAAGPAARYIAGSAAGYIAGSAAWLAARFPPWSAAGFAAMDKRNRKLAAMVIAEHKKGNNK